MSATTPHRARLVAALAVLAVLVSGCQTRVTSRVVVTEADRAVISATVTFTGEAAVAATRGDNLEQLRQAFAARTGVEPEVERDGDQVGVTAQLTYDQLTGASDVLGLSQMSLQPHPDGTTTVTTELVEPTALARAVADAVASDDTGATYAALAESTRLVTRIDLPGGVERARVTSGVPARVEDTHVVVDRSLADSPTGQVTVTGTPGQLDDGRGPLGLPWPVLVGGVVALLALGGVYARRGADA